MLEVPLLLFADRSSWSRVLLLGKQMRKGGGGQWEVAAVFFV